MLWTKGILLEYVRSALLRVPGLGSLANYVIPALLMFGFFLAYKTFSERVRGADFAFVAVCVVAYIAEYFLYPRNQPYFDVLFSDFVKCLPFYFVGIALRGDDKEIVSWMYRVSCVSICTFAFYRLFINQMASIAQQGGDMYSSYSLLPHACLSFYFLMKNFKWRRLVLFFLAAVCLLMMGTRGPILCLLVFMITTIILTIRSQKPLVVLGMVMLCLLLLFFGSLTDLLIEWSYSIADTFGLSTRVLDKMLSGHIADSSGRIYIRKRILYYLAETRILGLGIYGDLFVSEGMYAHNLILELWAHFGYYIGTLLVVALCVFITRGAICCVKLKDENAKLIVFLLLCCCVKLLVSSSYLREPLLWALLGYTTALLREKRTNIRDQRQNKITSKYIR